MNTQLSWLMSGLLAATLLACEKGAAPEAQPVNPAPASAPVAPAEPAPAAEAELPVAADFRAEAEAAIPTDADLNAALDALEKEIDAAE